MFTYFCSNEEKTHLHTWHKLWQDGLLLSGAQNFARELMETPSNLMTPTIFAETLTQRLSDIENVQVFARYRVRQCSTYNMLLNVKI